MSFEDHFSRQAAVYAQARPHYPDALFEFLAGLVSHHDCAWDCATGNGQAASGLARYFRKVIATDASAEQIRNAQKHERIEYYVALAEHSGLGENSVDLITVATAAHWLDLPAFYEEVNRVARQDAAVAIWTYGYASVSGEINELLYVYMNGTLRGYWPEGREHIDSGYKGIYFPFVEVTVPLFSIELSWTVEEMMEYLLSWSATQRYIQKNQVNPLHDLKEVLAPLWGDNLRTVTWPIMIKAGYVHNTPDGNKKAAG